MLRKFHNIFVIAALVAISACSPSSSHKTSPQASVAHTQTEQHTWTKKFDGYRFRSFASMEDDREAFRRMFPQGTPRAFVEHILIEKAGARIGRDGANDARKRQYYLVSYVEPRTLLRGEIGPWDHAFYYDYGDRVLNIKPFGEEDLYAEPRTCKLSEHPLDKC